MAEQQVTLQPSESKLVSFEAVPQEARAYQVTVDGLVGSFVAHAEITETFLSSPSDGFTEHWWEEEPLATKYSFIHNAYSSLWVGYTGKDARIGQLRDELGYLIDRAYVFFDTSPLKGCPITGAVLSIYGARILGETNYDIIIQSGMPTYPHDPPREADYYHGYYKGNGGSFPVAGFNTRGYNDIVLTPEGISWINKEGWTKFCLRSSKDIDAISPKIDTNEEVDFYTREQGINYAPKLVVNYIR